MSEVLSNYETNSSSTVFLDIKEVIEDLKNEVKFLQSMNRFNPNVKYTAQPQILILKKIIRKYEGMLNG